MSTWRLNSVKTCTRKDSSQFFIYKMIFSEGDQVDEYGFVSSQGLKLNLIQESRISEEAELSLTEGKPKTLEALQSTYDFVKREFLKEDPEGEIVKETINPDHGEVEIKKYSKEYAIYLYHKKDKEDLASKITFTSSQKEEG